MFPTPWTVEVLHYVTGATDAYGNDVDAWVELSDIQAVYGWAPAGTTEVGGWQRQIVADRELYAPAGFRCGPHDKVTFPDGTYTVEGDVEDYNHGPFGFAPGLRVNLTRVTG